MKELLSIELLQKHSGLILAVANRRKHFLTALGIKNEEILQAGFIAIIKSYDSFDPNKSKFSTYFWHLISYEIYRLTGVCNRGFNLNVRATQITHMIQYLTYQEGRPPTVLELRGFREFNASILDDRIADKLLESLLELENLKSKRLDPTELDTRSETLFNRDVDLGLEEIESTSSVHYILKLLKGVEKQVLVWRLGLLGFKEHTFTEIGQKQGGSTRQNAYIIYKRAIERLKVFPALRELLNK